MRILVTGSSGLIGSALLPFLGARGHSVTRLVRSEPTPGEPEVHWDPASGILDAGGLEGLEGVVHLAGENVVGRWTRRKKVRIRESRVRGTQLLAEALSRFVQPPAVLVSASAIGYYGNRGEEILDEESSPGAGFLAGVGRDWEAATEPAVGKGIRVVKLRIGLALSPLGGVLARVLLPFQIGLGGKIGSGTQFISWIAIDDLVGVVLHALTNEALEGPVNAVAPNPVTNLEFTKTLGRVLRRPALLPVPAFALRLAFGEMAEDLLLASTRAVPRRLLATGFQFRFPELGGALRHMLGKRLTS